jgi:hypothetical protein
MPFGKLRNESDDGSLRVSKMALPCLFLKVRAYVPEKPVTNHETYHIAESSDAQKYSINHRLWSAVDIMMY